MPELAEPIINEGLAYETGEHIDRAAEFYQDAYDRHPHHPVAIASLVRVRIKQDADADEIGFLLDELIMHDGRQPWVEWAKELRATKYRSQCDTCPPEVAMEVAKGTANFEFLETPRNMIDLRNELIPMQESPGIELVPTPIEDLGSPNSSILIPPVNGTPSDVDLSSDLDPNRPVRIPFETTFRAASAVETVSFELPSEWQP
ncbi:tetratricopeptide repeat protein [Rubripirellula lacrimiformis]|nr:hypothetical protein [Rubripirellula lacrimiformis]